MHVLKNFLDYSMQSRVHKIWLSQKVDLQKKNATLGIILRTLKWMDRHTHHSAIDTLNHLGRNVVYIIDCVWAAV